MKAIDFFSGLLCEADWSSGKTVMDEIRGNKINGVSPKYSDLGEEFFSYCVEQAKKRNIPLKNIMQPILRNETKPGFSFDPYTWYSKYRVSPNFKKECEGLRSGALSPHAFEQAVIAKVGSSGTRRIRNETGSGKVLYDKDGWKVVVPQNFEQSVKLASSIKQGEKAHWCTAADKTYYDIKTCCRKLP